MASEKFANLAETTLAADYTSGGASITVTSASGFPTTGVFRVRLGNAGKTIYRVDSVAGAVFTGGAEANDANASTGQTVVNVGTRAVAERFLQSPDAGEIRFPSGVSAADFYGPAYKLTALDQSGWAWTNQGSAAVTQSGGIVYISTPPNGGTNVRFRGTTQPATPYVITALMMPNPMWGNSLFGIGFRESGTGKLCGMTLRTPSGDTRPLPSMRRQNSPTSFNSQSEPASGPIFFPGPIFFRIENDGTTLRYKHSYDGINFREQLNEAKNAFFTTAPDEVGLWLESFASDDIGADVLSWKVT